MKKQYESPKLSAVGDIRTLTKSGSPNEAYDGGSIFDFFGPEAVEKATKLSAKLRNNQAT